MDTHNLLPLQLHIGRGDDAVGDPRRAQIYQFEPFELVLILKLDEQFPVEHSEPTAFQSTVPSPLLIQSELHK